MKKGKKSIFLEYKTKILESTSYCNDILGTEVVVSLKVFG